MYRLLAVNGMVLAGLSSEQIAESTAGPPPMQPELQQLIERQFADLLKGLSLEPEVLAWVSKALR